MRIYFIFIVMNTMIVSTCYFETDAALGPLNNSKWRAQFLL